MFGAAATLGATGIAEASIVAPNTLTATEGDLNNSFPLDINNPVLEDALGFSIESMRYQQVYDATEFAAYTAPFLITEIQFRPDATMGDAFSSILTDIQINLSTTAASADGLSTTFANNVGVDDTVVLNRGALPLSSTDVTTPTGSQEFDIAIQLDTPFRYDPTAGNLLLDIRNFGGGVTTPLDAVFVEGDSTSRLFNGFLGDSVDNPTGIADTVGLVTKFVVAETPVSSEVPEPSSLVALLVAGATAASTLIKHG